MQDFTDGERALTFALGLLITIGILLYTLYTAVGFALLPVAFIKSSPGVSGPALGESTASELEQNRERQRQLEMRNEGAEGGLPAKDRRELEALVREERTLQRRERLAAEARGEDRNWFIRAYIKVSAALRPIKLLGGVLLMVIAIIVWISMILTFADKAKNSACKHQIQCPRWSGCCFHRCCSTSVGVTRLFRWRRLGFVLHWGSTLFLYAWTASQVLGDRVSKRRPCTNCTIAFWSARL